MNEFVSLRSSLAVTPKKYFSKEKGKKESTGSVSS
jgi:hypothetical protein